MTEPGASQITKTPLYIALALAILLVLGVLIGAKLVYSNAAQQPVGMTTLDSPDADSPECSRFLEALPEKVLGHKRAEIAEPAPAGAAAWSSNSTEQLTLRCGVNLPLQYNELSTLTESSGVQWLQVIDATPGSTMQTWYSIDTFPVIAVTADDPALGDATSPVTDLGDALGTLEERSSEPNPVPLSELAAPEANSPECIALAHALSQDLGDRYAAASLQKPVPGLTAWTKPGHESIVVRCGVDDPAGYEAGVQLNQVDEIAWFEDSTLANGTTAGAYYALGRNVNVALSMPTDAGNAAITTVSGAIAANTKAE